jgi:uncharacterized protein
MANALQEQLLKAGLVNEKELKKAQKEKRKDANAASSRKESTPDRGEALRQQAQEKARRDRELNHQRTEAAAQKALAAQIRQLVAAHRVPPGEGDQPYRFADGGKVKQLYLSEAVRMQIIRGRLAIVRNDGRYDLVPAEVAEKIRERNPALVVLWNSPEPAPGGDKADEYGAYQVPDDLIW